MGLIKRAKIKRREFLKFASLGTISASLSPSLLLSFENANRSAKLHGLINSEYPFPYDSAHFEASERVVFIDSKTASISILPKEGKVLDIKLYYFQEDKMHICGSRLKSFYGVDDCLEVLLRNRMWEPELHYWIEYKESGGARWKSTPQRRVKTPRVSLEERNVEVILIGDDHSPDDADMQHSILEDDELRELRLTGDYVNTFLKKLLKEPEYLPEPGSEMAKLKNGFCLASTIKNILAAESPDFIITLGDHRGGFGHKWEGLGLKNQYQITAEERDQYEKLFRKGTRKIFSALTPQVPVYWALGNHDGEPGYDLTQEPATKYRKIYYKLPGSSVGGSPDENYYAIEWGSKKRLDFRNPQNMEMIFLVLDPERYNTGVPKIPEDWTLGEDQQAWFKEKLKCDAKWKFVVQHHVLGGWPRGTNEMHMDRAYGRGPLFTYQDYDGICDYPQQVEQVRLTEVMKENGVDIVFYGHDHIFNVKEIGENSLDKTLYGICVGSPKYIGEISWYKGEFWGKFYGNYGEYGGNNKLADFWGPSGYTKLTIGRESVKVEYIRAAFNHPFTNIPPDIRVGDTVYSYLI